MLADAAVPLADDVFDDADTRGDKHHSGKRNRDDGKGRGGAAAGAEEDAEEEEGGDEEEEEEEWGEEEEYEEGDEEGGDEDEGEGDEGDQSGGDEEDDGSVPRSMAYVLAYELLFGAGLEEREGSEKAAPAAEALLRAAKAPLAKALKRRLKAANASDGEAFLLAQPGGRALAQVPAHSRHVRVNTLKTTLQAAEAVGPHGCCSPRHRRHAF